MKKTKHFSLYMSTDKSSGGLFGAKFETTLETEEGEEITEEALGERVRETTLEDIEKAKKSSAIVREIYRDFVKGVKKKRKIDKAMESL